MMIKLVVMTQWHHNAFIPIDENFLSAGRTRRLHGSRKKKYQVSSARTWHTTLCRADSEGPESER